MRVPLEVGLLHVEDRHVGDNGPYGQELFPAERACDGLKMIGADKITSARGLRGKKRYTHCRSLKA